MNTGKRLRTTKTVGLCGLQADEPYISERLRGLTKVGVQVCTFALLAFSLSCRNPESKNQYQSPAGLNPPAVDPKYSLAADRQAVEDLRQNIPAQRKAENDEEALMLQLFSDVKRNPMDIRSTFDQMLRKKRELFDRDMNRERDQFNWAERKSRDEFLKSQSKERERITQNKSLGKEERAEFFKDQDTRRREFFADERDKRNDFESQIREKRKNFEDYTRAKTNEFNAEMRAFQKKHDEAKK